MQEKSANHFFVANPIPRKRIKKIIQISAFVPDFSFYNTQEEAILGTGELPTGQACGFSAHSINNMKNVYVVASHESYGGTEIAHIFSSESAETEAIEHHKKNNPVYQYHYIDYFEINIEESFTS